MEVVLFNISIVAVVFSLALLTFIRYVKTLNVALLLSRVTVTVVPIYNSHTGQA